MYYGRNKLCPYRDSNASTFAAPGATIGITIASGSTGTRMSNGPRALSFDAIAACDADAKSMVSMPKAFAIRHRSLGLANTDA